MMRVQVMSDLHLGYPGARGIPPLAPGVELVLVAGDTVEGLVKAVEALRRAYERTEIAMVAGNHEFYGSVWSEELEAGRERARALGVHFLENDTVIFSSKIGGRLRVIGATGWTDYELFGEGFRDAAMRSAADAMRDHKKIKWRKEPWQRFRPQEARALHLRWRSYLDAELGKPHDAAATLVLCHHAPTIEAIAPLHQRTLLASAYASEMLPIVDRHQPDYVVSGHTHVSMNLRRGHTRLISNPCGYANENPFFDPQFTIEVGDG